MSASPRILHTGQPAPAFSLPDADMQTVSLAEFKGHKKVVLYFYPRDGTPACTMVATEFSDHEDQLAKHEAVVLGISRDDFLTHAAFRDKHGLSITLLSDTDGEVCRKYGVLQEKEMEDGARRELVVRSTFVVDKKGVIRHAAYGVSSHHHALEIIEVVKGLRG